MMKVLAVLFFLLPSCAGTPPKKVSPLTASEIYEHTPRYCIQAIIKVNSEFTIVSTCTDNLQICSKIEEKVDSWGGRFNVVKHTGCFSLRKLKTLHRSQQLQKR